MRVLFYTAAVIAALSATSEAVKLSQAAAPVAEAPSERAKRQNQELIAKTVAEANKPKPVPAEAKGSSEAKPTGPKAEGQKPSEGGPAMTGKEPLVSAVITKPEQLEAGLKAIDDQVCANAKRVAQNKSNAEIIAKMNKAITDANEKKKGEISKEGDAIKEKEQKQEQADKRAAKEEETKRKADKLIKEAKEEQEEKAKELDRKIADATARLKKETEKNDEAKEEATKAAVKADKEATAAIKGASDTAKTQAEVKKPAKGGQDAKAEADAEVAKAKAEAEAVKAECAGEKAKAKAEIEAEKSKAKANANQAMQEAAAAKAAAAAAAAATAGN